MTADTTNALHLLFVEDDANDYALVLRALSRAGLRIDSERVADMDGLRDALARRTWDCVIADYTLGGADARDALAVVRAAAPDLPFIVVSGSVGEERVAELMAQGAGDYVMKDNLLRLAPAVRREIREAGERLARKSAEERVQRLAYVDASTGLPNATAMMRRLSEEVRPGMSAAMQLALVDLVGYTELNLTLGSFVAEEVMRELASRLDAAVHGGVVARWSPRTFAVFAPAADGVLPLMETLARQVEQTFESAGRLYDIRLRFGVALAPDDAAEPEVLVRHALVALAQGRQRGESTVRYDAARDEYSQRRFALSSEVRHAADAGQLFLVWQPRVCLTDRSLSGFEALLRWRHPRFGLVPPVEFIGIAEHTGAIGPITSFVLRMAAGRASALAADGHRVPVAVNVPVRLIEGPGFADEVKRVLDRESLTPDALEIEVTESQLMQDASAVQGALATLRAMGTHVFIDDFGTGFSSLGYLRDLPVHGLKIDKSFVVPGFAEARSRELVRTIVDLGHVLGLRVVAEGVETAAALASLRELGCDEAQGYHIARPMETSAIPAWIAAWSASAPS